MATTYRTKGVSLAKGPVGLIGVVLLAYGITALIFGGHGFADHVPNGAVYGKTWLGLLVNGWSGLLFIAAGLLLLLSAPLHFTAKGFSLIVAIALGAIAVIAVVNGHGALGLFAANHLTEIVWAAGAVLLLCLSLLPRVGARTEQRYDGAQERYDQPDHQTVPSKRVGNRSRTARDLPRRRRSAALNGSSDRGSANGNPVTNTDASTTTTRPQRSSTTSTHSEEDQHV